MGVSPGVVLMCGPPVEKNLSTIRQGWSHYISSALPPRLWRLTLVVSRANSRSEGRAKAVGVGSSALFGPDAPPRSARTCPDSAPAVDSTTRPHPHDQRPQTRDRDNTPPVSTLDDAHRVWAPAPERCRIATATTHTRQPPHGRLEMGCLLPISVREFRFALAYSHP